MHLVPGKQEDSDCKKEDGPKSGQKPGLEGLWC